MNAHQCRANMGRDQWNALSETACLTWDKLDNELKAIILGYNKPKASTPLVHEQLYTGKLTPALKPPTPTVNFHETESTNTTESTTKVTELTKQEEQQECQNCTTNDDDKDVIIAQPHHQMDHSKKPGAKSTGSQGKKTQTRLPPGNIQRLLGNPGYSVSMAKITYHVTPTKIDWSTKYALVYRRANGGLIGTDMRIIDSSKRTIDLSGVNDHTVNDLRIVNTRAVCCSQRGDIIVIAQHQAQFAGATRPILSSPQMDFYKNIVGDCSPKVGGKQCITTNDGYIFPLNIRDKCDECYS